MTKEDVMARWKESEKRSSQKQKPLVFNCIVAKEIVYNAYKAGFINWNVYNLAMERIERTMNGSWMFKEQPDKAYEELIEKEWLESLIENQKSINP